MVSFDTVVYEFYAKIICRLREKLINEKEKPSHVIRQINSTITIFL